MSGVRTPAGNAVALDWGCGGGAGLVALAPMSRHLIAVDISATNLREARKQVRLAKIDGEPTVKVQTITVGPNPVEVAEQIAEPVDLFVSHATFPHLPNERYAETVLRTGYAVMRPGALGYVQIRYRDELVRTNATMPTEYPANFIRATSWTLPEFWVLLEDIGFETLSVGNISSGTNFAAFYVRKR